MLVIYAGCWPLGSGQIAAKTPSLQPFALFTVVSRKPPALILFRARIVPRYSSLVLPVRVFPMGKRAPDVVTPSPFDDYIALYDTRYPLSEILCSKPGRVRSPCIGDEIYLHLRWIRKRARAIDNEIEYITERLFFFDRTLGVIIDIREFYLLKEKLIII